MVKRTINLCHKANAAQLSQPFMTGVQLTRSCPAATRHLRRIVQAIHHTGDATMLQGLLPDKNCPKLESSKSKNTHTMTNSVCTVSNWIVTPLWWFPIRTESVWRPQAQPVDIVRIPSHSPVEVKDLACFRAFMVLTPPALRASLQQRDIPRVNAVGHHLIKGQNCTFPYLHIQMPASRYMQHLSTHDMISQVSIGNVA